MKKTFLFLCLTFGVIYAHAQSVSPDFGLENIIQKEREHYGKIIQHGEKYDIGDNYDLKFYRFDLEINPSQLFIRGAVTSHFVITAESAVSVSFELSAQLTVDSVLYHGESIDFTRTGKKVEAELPALITMGILDSLTIHYHGVPTNEGGFSSFTKSTQNGIPIIWTLSQPYGASDWWPCKNVLNDKIDSIDVNVKTPSQYKVASNGILAGQTVAGQQTIYHWKHRYPIETYLIALAVTKYSVYTNYATLSTGQLPVVNYVYPNDSATAANQTPAIIPVLELYDSLFGPYPFHLEKYGHAQFGWGGGMEHQTMSFMANFGHDLMAHELAHSWFGDFITCGSWSDIWLNEGFATYATALTYEHLFSQQTWMQWKSWVRNYVTNQPGGSVYCPDTTSISRIFDGRLSYNKGATVLHMLRWVVGDQKFYQAVRNYLDDPLLKFGYARTEDLKAHVEAVAEMDLTWFFDQWVYGEGYPTYMITATLFPQNQVRIEINQTQSHPSVEFFRMPLQITLKDGVNQISLVLDNTYNNQEYFIPLNFSPQQIIFDPDIWILSRNNQTTVNLGSQSEDGIIKAYPNPGSGDLYVDCSKCSPEKLVVYNAEGKELGTYTQPEHKKFVVPAAQLPKGTCIARVFCEDGNNYSVKIIRE